MLNNNHTSSDFFASCGGPTRCCLQIGMHASDRNQEATVYVGNLDPQNSEELVWELFVQAGPVGEFSLRERELKENQHNLKSITSIT